MSLRTLADEVSRVSLEVGSQGKLGGQAQVPDVEGVWKEMTVNVRSGLIRSEWRKMLRPSTGESDVHELDGPSEEHRKRNYRCRQGGWIYARWDEN